MSNALIKVRIFVMDFWSDLFLNFTYENMQVEFMRITAFNTYRLLKRKDNALSILFIRYSQWERLAKAKMIKIQKAKSKVIVVEDSAISSSVIKSLQLGAHGYLIEPTLNELYSAISSVVNEEIPLSPSVVSSLVNSYRLNNDSVLTPREQEILLELAKGCSYKLICERLFISMDTVRSHIRRIYYKLDATNKDGALEKARSSNLI